MSAKSRDYEDRWCEKYKSRLRHGHYERVSSEGRSLRTGSYENGRRIGAWMEENGGSTEEGMYLDDQRTGIWTRWTQFSDEPNLVELSYWKAGQRQDAEIPQDAWAGWAPHGKKNGPDICDPIEKSLEANVRLQLQACLAELDRRKPLNEVGPSHAEPKSPRREKSAPNAPSSPAIAAAPTGEPPSAWRYDSRPDEMTGKQVRTALTVSSNTIKFGSPYEGIQRAALSLTAHPRFGRSARLAVMHGQFLYGLGERCSILVRFDEEQPKRYPCSAPNDGRHDVLFIGNDATFAAKLLGTHSLKVEVGFYQEGTRVLEFDVRGLDWPPHEVSLH